ncbi:major facilitator superfamily domain-containing protein [Dichotomocladium elegans]|nr:major facilitator superfamily domain-containing protein [Dichotomocladium elegans]
MQDYYQRNVFYELPNPAFQLSFVGTFVSVFANCMGPVAHVLNSIFGVRVVMSVGTLCIAVGIFIASFAKEIWHLYLTQGVCFGTGVSLMYITIMSVAPQYFDKKRGFALGLVASGSGIGGLIIPFIMTPINRSLGAAWTYRVLGFICLFCDVVAVIVVKDRIKRKTGRKKLSELIRFDVFKNQSYCLWVAGGTVQLMPYFVPYFYLPAYATWLGLTDSQGSSLVAVTSAMNFVGRIVCGLIADRLGHVNTNIIFLVICCLSNFLIWTFAYTYATLMAFAVVFGLACGSFFTLVSPLTASILGMEKFPTGLSMLLLFNVISIFAVNVANAIEDSINAEPFFSYKIFTGTLYAISLIIILCLKHSMNRKFFIKI